MPVADLFKCAYITESELRRLGALELKLELVRDQGDELRIGGLTLGIGYRVAKEFLQGVQVAPIPGNLNGVADGPFHSAGRGAEVLGHLGVEHLGDGIGVFTARLRASWMQPENPTKIECEC